MQQTEQIWSGYFEKGDKRIDLSLKGFECPPEGGPIIAHTADNKTAKGMLQSNREFKFTLEAINGQPTLYFEGDLSKDRNQMTGHYGFNEGEAEQSFKLLKKEVQSQVEKEVTEIVVQKCCGHYMKGQVKIALTFKDFSCPPAGGTITGQTIDGKTVKGTIQANRDLQFTLEKVNGEPILYFDGTLAKDKNSINGQCGVEKDDLVYFFKLLLEEVQVKVQKDVIIQKWSGFYMKDDQKIEITFKEFKCPPEGGAITGQTIDGKTVKGTIQTNRELKFTFETFNGQPILYFRGTLNKNKNTINGISGVIEDEAEANFKLFMEEVRANQEETNQMWTGYYMNRSEKIEVTFKDFTCPLDGGVISGHTIDGKTAKGMIKIDGSLDFILQATNSEAILYFQGIFNKKKNFILGNCGFEKDDCDGDFKIYMKDTKVTQNEEKWSGYYNRNEETKNQETRSLVKFGLKFKDFTCPPEGGVITGHTDDGQTVKGTIRSDRSLDFTLKSVNGRVAFYFFEASISKDKKSITGLYGFSLNEPEGQFKLFKEDNNPIQPLYVCHCAKCRTTLTIKTIDQLQSKIWICEFCFQEKGKGTQVYQCAADNWGCCALCAKAVAQGNCICGRCGNSIEKSKFQYEQGMICFVCTKTVPNGSDVYHCSDNWDCCVSCYEEKFKGKKTQPTPTDPIKPKQVITCGKCGKLLNISQSQNKKKTCDLCYREIVNGSDEYQCKEDNWDCCLQCATEKADGKNPQPKQPIIPKIQNGNRQYSQEMVQAIAFVESIIKSGKPWTDEKFPPYQRSLATRDDTQKVQNHMEFLKPTWSRASQICTTPTIFGDKINPSDVQQGQLGNCYFLATLSAMAEIPERVKARFYTKEVNRAGIYLMVFFINGKETPVYVDDYFPVLNNQPCFAQCKGKLWVMLLEKAWAKIYGTYGRTQSGLCGVAADHILGVTSDSIQGCKWENGRNLVWQKVTEAQRRKFVMMACTAGYAVQRANGLFGTHAYTVISVHEAEGKQLIRIRNPHGCSEWNGEYNDKSYLWTPSLKKEVGWIDKDDGMFFMTLKDFLTEFDSIEICVDDDIFGKDQHSQIEYTFSSSELVFFTFELHQKIDVTESIFSISCIQQGPRIQYWKQRKFESSCFEIKLMTSNSKMIFRSYRKQAFLCFNQSVLVEKEQGILQPGTYVVSIKPDWDSSARNHPEFKRILLDIYCPEQLTISQLHQDYGQRIYDRAYY